MTRTMFTIAGMDESVELSDGYVLFVGWPAKRTSHLKVLTLSDVCDEQIWMQNAFYQDPHQFKAFILPFVFSYLAAQNHTSAIYVDAKAKISANFDESANAVLLSPVLGQQESTEAKFSDQFFYLKFNEETLRFLQAWKEAADPRKFMQSIPLYLPKLTILPQVEVALADSKESYFPCYSDGKKITNRDRKIFAAMHPVLKREIGNPFMNADRIRSYGEKSELLDQECLRALQHFELSRLQHHAILNSYAYRLGYNLLLPIKWIFRIFRSV